MFHVNRIAMSTDLRAILLSGSFILIAIIGFSSPAPEANSVTVQVVDENGSTDTIVAGYNSRLEITIANDVPLTGLGLGFTAYSPDGAYFATGICYDSSGSFSGFPDCPWAGIVPGSRASQVSWLVGCLSYPSPDQCYLGLTATGDAMAAGEAEHMLSICFIASGPQAEGEIRTLCFDSMLYPPAGEFVFVDAQQNSIIPDFNGPVCVPVLSAYECYAIITNDNPTEVTVDHGETAQVTISAWTLDQGAAEFRINSVTGGNGIATVTPIGDPYGIVTYAPAPEDVDNTVAIEVAATCVFGDFSGAEIWTLLVHVTNQPLTAEFGRDAYCAAIDNPFRKRDITASDSAGAPLEFFQISGPGETDPATGYYLWTPDVDDYGLHTVEMGVTDGYDTLTGSFTIDVRDITCCPGDVNADCTVNIADAVYYLDYVFRSGPTPPVMNWADPNYDCGPGIGDIVFIINYIFKYGPAPEVGCLEFNR